MTTRKDSDKIPAAAYVAAALLGFILGSIFFIAGMIIQSEIKFF